MRGGRWKLFCLIYPAIWLYLPNLVLLWVDPSLTHLIKAAGLIFSVLCTAPFLLCLSHTLRQFWLWNLPFALLSGGYAAYINLYHDIPYDGVWFALWTTRLDVDVGMMRYFFSEVCFCLLGFSLYVICLLHPTQQIPLGKPFRQYALGCSLLAIALVYNSMQFLSQRIPVQRFIDVSVLAKSYPYGMLGMCIKTVISVAHRQIVSVAAMPRQSIPLGREIYVFVIGEAARADDWQMISRRMHSPLLTDPDIRIFPDTVSQANLTGFSLPLLMTGTSTLQEALNHPTWLAYAKAAGCKTGWITNSTEPFPYSYQSDFYDLNFNHGRFSGITSVLYDEALLPEIARAITQGPQKLCLIVHLIGSHFDYRERYRSDQIALPVNSMAYQASYSPAHTEAMHNAFKNSIFATNLLLQKILAILKQQEGISLLLYTSDHGESFDDFHDHQFFHGNPHPHAAELRVPCFIWANKRFQTLYSQKWRTLSQQTGNSISNRQMVPTLLDALNIVKRPSYLSSSLFQKNGLEQKRMVFLPSTALVDFNSIDYLPSKDQ